MHDSPVVRQGAADEASDALDKTDVRCVWSGRLPVATYDHNDLLIRVRDAAGTLLPPLTAEAWTAIVAASSTEVPLYLAIDGRPAPLDALITPAHRLWFYGDAGVAYAAFHLGGDGPSLALGARDEVATRHVYPHGPDQADSQAAEAVRTVTFLAVTSRRARAAALGRRLPPPPRASEDSRPERRLPPRVPSPTVFHV